MIGRDMFKKVNGESEKLWEQTKYLGTAHDSHWTLLPNALSNGFLHIQR